VGPGEGAYELVDDEQGPLEDVNRYLDAQRIRGLSPKTIAAYAYDLLWLYRWMSKSSREIKALRQADLIDFVRMQREASAAPASINRRLMVTRLLYRFCVGEPLPAGPGSIAPSPHYRGQGRISELGLHRRRRKTERVLTVKAPVKVVDPLTPDEVRRFLRSLRRYRDLAIVYAMLLCGLRSCEILRLELSDLALHDRQLRVRGKGGRERVLPLPDSCRIVLEDYLEIERPRTPSPHVFVVLQGKRRGQPMSSAGLRSLFRQRRLVPALQRANPHRFRHTFGADMARSGVRLPVLQKLMGHADTATTLRYITLSMVDLAAEFRLAMRALQKRY
jgi:site-specific recombinase XerD